MLNHHHSILTKKHASIKPFQLSSTTDFDEMLEILTKNTGSRTEFELTRLKLTFSEIFPFFNKMQSEGSEKTVFDLLKELSYEFQQKRKTLFEIGDAGSKFYIMLKGSVYVLAREKGLETSPGESQLQKLQRNSSLNNVNFSNSSDLLAAAIRNESPLARQQSIKYDKLIGKLGSITGAKISKLAEELPDDEFFMLKYPDLYIDRVLKFGDSFGELALRHDDSKRTATIVCKEDCHFGVISKNAFQRALKTHFDQIISNNLKVFKRHPVFAEWGPAQLEQFFHHINTRTLIKNQIIYHENDIADCFFLIKEGEVELSKEVKYHTEEKHDTTERLKTLIQNIGNHKKYVRIKISLLQTGEIFGLEDLVKSKTRTYRATCVSGRADVYHIAKDKFLAYANDFKTVSKVLQMKKNIDKYRNCFLDNTLDLLQKSNESQLIDMQNILKNESERHELNEKYKTRMKRFQEKREKFEGKLHILDVNYDPDKSLEILEKLDKSIDFNHNKPFIIFDEFIQTKKDNNKNKSKINSNFYSYEKLLTERDEKKSISYKNKDFTDAITHKYGLSFINFIDSDCNGIDVSIPHVSASFSKQPKKKKNISITKKNKITENSHEFTHFPKINDDTNKIFNADNTQIYLTGFGLKRKN